MAQGTGLPLPKERTELAQAPSINADAVSSAGAWREIASAGERLSATAASVGNAAIGVLDRAAYMQEAGAIADFENEWRQKNIEARDEFAKDPEGFRVWAEASIDGVRQSAPTRIARHAENYLKRTFDGTYATLLNEKRAQDERLAGQALTFRHKTADEDVMGLAAAGKAGTPEFGAAVAVHQSVLDTAVVTGVMAQEQADYIRDDLASRAQGEVAARTAVQTYREKGFDAAVEHITKNVRENSELSLTQAQRDKVFNRALSQIRLEQSRDKEGREAAVQAANGLIAQIDSNQEIDPGDVKVISDELGRTGAFAVRRRLNAKAIGYDLTAPYRAAGGKPLPQLGAELALLRRELAPALQAGVEAASLRRGVDPNYLTRTAIRESGGDLNARAPTSSAEGPFQFTEQTWLATVKQSGEYAPEMAAKIEQEGGRYVVRDPQERAKILGLRRDPAFSAEMAATFTAGNAAALKAGLGRDASAGELYTAHFLGADGALTMIRADKGAKAADINPAAAAANYNVFYTKDGRAKTVGEVLDNLDKPMAADPARASLDEGVKIATKFYVAQERKSWPEMRAILERGQLTDPAEFEGMHYAARISGDPAWLQEVETFARARGIGLIIKGATEGRSQALLDQMRQRIEAAGGTISDRTLFNTIEKQVERQRTLAREDPIGLWLETDPTAKPPPALDLTNPTTAKAGLAARIDLAWRAAAAKETPLGSPLRPADRASVAAAISYGAPAQASAALDMLASAPDDALLATVGVKEIKDAVVGAARSTDPNRYQSAMSFLDRLNQRAPEEIDRLFGADTAKDLAVWQISRRYVMPGDQAADRTKKALDPQVRDHLKRQFDEGLEIARKFKFDEVVGKFNTSWWTTFGIGSAVGPADAISRATLMGDWQQNVARIYAETGDKDGAIEKATEITRTKWTASPTNGGRLMLNAPEKYYPAVGGSWDWMKAQAEAEIGRTGLGTRFDEADPISPQTRWDWELVADRQTESEAQRGQPPSYLVRITDHTKGGAISVLPQRYRFESSAPSAKAEEAFAQQRARVMASSEPIAAQFMNDRRRLELY